MRTGRACIGDRLLITKGVALQGTIILTQGFADVARRLELSEKDLIETRDLMVEVSVVPEALAAQAVTAMHGGPEAGFWIHCWRSPTSRRSALRWNLPGCRSLSLSHASPTRSSSTRCV